MILQINNISASCDKKLVQSYGMKVFNTPQDIKLMMCPTIKKSCCQIADQKVIYGNWIISKEESNVENHYKITLRLYKEVLNILKVTTSNAEKLANLQKDKKQGNCKILANLIIGFDIKKQTKALNFAIAKVEDFFIKSYKGIYCAICDADKQKFISSLSGKVTLSQTYCRSMLKSNLTPLLYFHNHFVKVSNIVSRFLTNCTFKGDYVVDNIIPKNVLFKFDPVVNKNLDSCRRYRNDNNWFVYCKKICSKFTVGKFSKFFDGNRKVLTEFIKYSQMKIKNLAKEAKKQPLLSGMRILAAKKKNKKKKAVKKKKKVKPNKIFTSVIGAPFRLEATRTVFSEDGLDLYFIGNSAAISKGIFENIKNSLIGTKPSSRALLVTSNTNRKLSSIKILSIFSLLFLLI